MSGVPQQPYCVHDEFVKGCHMFDVPQCLWEHGHASWVWTVVVAILKMMYTAVLVPAWILSHTLVCTVYKSLILSSTASLFANLLFSWHLQYRLGIVKTLWLWQRLTAVGCVSHNKNSARAQFCCLCCLWLLAISFTCQC